MEIRERIDAVARCLADRGWSKEALDGYCVGEKAFEILDGVEKTALIWATPWHIDDVLHIKGEYWSEGNNVLSSLTLSIDGQCNREDIQKGVSEFLRAVEFDISESYGVRMRV